MSDLIDRQAVIDVLAAMQGRCTSKAALIQNSKIWQQIKDLPSAQPKIIRCKECKHFEYNHIEKVNGISLIVAHEICMRWCEGAKTSENGYCFLAERKQDE